MIVIDNFLPPSFHNDLVHLLEGERFPWYYCGNVTHTDGSDDSYYFAHLALDVDEQGCEQTQFFDHIRPMLYFIEDKAKFRLNNLMRVKCGMYPNIGYAKKNQWHTDREENHYVGLYYVNSTDGPTDIGDTSVECVANRFVLFDGSISHRSTHPTNVKSRINININMHGFFIE